MWGEGCREWNSGEVLRTPSCLKEYTVATGTIRKQGVRKRCAVDTHQLLQLLQAVLCYSVTRYGTNFRTLDEVNIFPARTVFCVV
jgi:hypothetical protein